MNREQKQRLVDFLTKFTRELLTQKELEEIFQLEKIEEDVFNKNKEDFIHTLLDLKKKIPNNYFIGGNGLICNEKTEPLALLSLEIENFKEFYNNSLKKI